MLSVLLVATAATTPFTGPIFPCDGIRLIEASINDKPRPFASLRELSPALAPTRVKSINGFARCRFVYTSQIDLACYTGPSVERDQEEKIAEILAQTGEAVGSCLNDKTLVRSGAEAGSTPIVSYGSGPNKPFWQVSMVPLDEDPQRLQAEVIILPPTRLANPPQATPARATPRRVASKTKRRSR